MCVLVLRTALPATLHISARNQRHVVINVQRAAWTVRLLCGVFWNGNCTVWGLLERELYSVGFLGTGIVECGVNWNGNCTVWGLLERELYCVGFVGTGIVQCGVGWNGNCTVWGFVGTGNVQSDIRKISDTKINENPYSWSRFIQWGQTDGQTDRHAEANICLYQLCERTSSPLYNPPYKISIKKMPSDRICSWAAIRIKLCYLVKWRWLDGSGQIEDSQIRQVWCVQKQTDWTECHCSRVPQKYWCFEMRLTAPAKETKSQGWTFPKRNADKL
jgi:hypothetical protein